MTLEESVLATRRQLLRAAEPSGNVSATCRLFNVSRAPSSDSRGRSCTSTGGSSFGARFSGACDNCKARSTRFWSSTTGGDRIKGIV